jgi:hypothetical protein
MEISEIQGWTKFEGGQNVRYKSCGLKFGQDSYELNLKTLDQFMLQSGTCLVRTPSILLFDRFIFVCSRYGII